MENSSDSAAPLVNYEQFRAFQAAVRAIWIRISTQGINYDEIKHTVALGLVLIDPFRPYGTELYGAIARLSVSVAVEMVCLRRDRGTGRLQVLMTLRASDDPAYPGEWHCPGSITRPWETPEDVFRRLEQREFGCPLDGIPAFITTLRPSRQDMTSEKAAGERGHCQSEVWLGKISAESKGTWYFVDQLPGNTVWSHRNRIIPAAVEEYERIQSVVERI